MTCTLAAKFGPGFVHTNCTCGVTEVSNRDVIPPPPRMPSNIGELPTERPINLDVGTRVFVNPEYPGDDFVGHGVVAAISTDGNPEIEFGARKGVRVHCLWDNMLPLTPCRSRTVTLPSGESFWPNGTGLEATEGGLKVTPPHEPNPKKAFGATKPDLALVPPVGTLHQAMAHELGAERYGAYNWREYPVEAMTYIGAIERHIQAFKDGEDYTSDSEDMVHNLGAVMASCAILLDSLELGILIDNRPPAGTASKVQDRMKAQKVAKAARSKP